MGVADMTIDTASIEAALFRSTGVVYSGMQYGPATNPATRNLTNKQATKGTGVGHVFMHDAHVDPTTGLHAPMSKSAYQNHTVMVAVLVEVLKSPAGQRWLKWLDDNPGKGDGVWLHGNTGLAVTGDWYGYAQGSDVLKKITKASVNMRAHGDALFITSSYPEAFAG